SRVNGVCVVNVLYIVFMMVEME
ncbi:MAG: hypothetical protein QG592_1812, partial [Pseudomonadota bacterium]|nr:hypothetical protein [Pseudomonadota bacterium]